MRTGYNIYCDESCHLEHDDSKVMVLGAVWCPKTEKEEAFTRLREIKAKHKLSNSFEVKWNKVSPGKLDFYTDVIDYFFDNHSLHFRALVVSDKSMLNHDVFKQTHDHFYYKMYFDLLKTILDPRCAYDIYLDIKDTKGQQKVDELQQVLCNNAYDFEKKIVRKIQQVRSHEVELVQLADLFIGAISYLHRGLQSSKAKQELINLLKHRSGYSLMKTTLFKEDKMNIFIWKPSTYSNGQ